MAKGYKKHIENLRDWAIADISSAESLCMHSNNASKEAMAVIEALTEAEKAIRSIPFLSQDPGVKKCYEWLCNYAGGK